MTSKTVSTLGLRLHRLNRAERNERQPGLQPLFGAPPVPQFWAEAHKVEAEVSFLITVDRSEDNALFKASNRAFSTAVEAFEPLREALALIGPGRVTIGSINVSGGLTPIPRPISGVVDDVPSGSVVLRKGNHAKLESFDLLRRGNSPDRVLERALRRFFLAGQRSDLEDRLVDLVIAWEALLLTQEKSAIMDELTYRFSINGSSLLKRAGRKEGEEFLFRSMQTAYRLRSAIVHGSSDKIPKLLAKRGLETIGDPVSFLEGGFRSAVDYLKDIPHDDRPYVAKMGWEKLLWSG